MNTTTDRYCRDFVGLADGILDDTCLVVTISEPITSSPGSNPVSSMAALAAAHEPARQAHHPQDNPHDQQDEGARDEREVFQKPSGQRLGHG